MKETNKKDLIHTQGMAGQGKDSKFNKKKTMKVKKKCGKLTKQKVQE